MKGSPAWGILLLEPGESTGNCRFGPVEGWEASTVPLTLGLAGQQTNGSVRSAPVTLEGCHTESHGLALRVGTGDECVLISGPP